MRGFDLATLLGVLAIAGCATPAVGPQVVIPTVCEENAKTVAFPAVEADPSITIAKTRAALAIANHTIVNTRDCIKGVREGFAKPLT